MTFTTALIENTSATTFATQLEADLATGVRGGNKFRLIARCWVAANGSTGVATYEAFRAAWQRQTFAKIHATFDHVLPAQYRADAAFPVATPRRAGRTEAQQRAWEKFQKAPARVAKQFRKDAEFFNPDSQPERVQDADHYAHLHNLQSRELQRAELVEALTTEQLLELFNAGQRTGGDLTSWAERQIRDR